MCKYALTRQDPTCACYMVCPGLERSVTCTTCTCCTCAALYATQLAPRLSTQAHGASRTLRAALSCTPQPASPPSPLAASSARALRSSRWELCPHTWLTDGSRMASPPPPSTLSHPLPPSPTRLDQAKPDSTPHNIPFVALGTALLWYGWFGFSTCHRLSATAAAQLAPAVIPTLLLERCLLRIASVSSCCLYRLVPNALTRLLSLIPLPLATQTEVRPSPPPAAPPSPPPTPRSPPAPPLPSGCSSIGGA